MENFLRLTLKTNKTMENLLPLTWRLLDEEIKIINDAYKSMVGGKLIYAKDRTFLIRYLSRNKKKLLVRLAEKITDKKLDDINFEENQIDQLKVRIILRKYLGKVIFKIGFVRFYLRLLSIKIYLNI
jgi:hypothetical protein